MKNNMQRVIGNIVILTPVIVGLVFYNQLPNQIAIHFNVEEQANGFMNRNLAIVALPFIALGGHVQVRLTVIWLVALIFLVIGNYLPKSLGLATKNHSESSKSVARKLGYLMVAMSLVLLISLCFNPYTTIMVLGIFIVLILSILLPNFRSLRK